MGSDCTYLYLCGPMRNYPLHNFPAFDLAKERLEKAGWHVVSPADLDRAAGLSPSVSGSDPGKEILRECMLRDLPALAECEAVAVLKGWELSYGVHVELAFARFLGMDILDAETMEPLDMEGYFPW